MNPFAATLEYQTKAWETAADALETSVEAPESAERMADVEVGSTPSEVVYSENKLELLRYDAEAAGIEPEVDRDVPILVVYALINRPYILDLQPDRSVVRRLLEGGFDVYLIDWGEPSQLDASLTLEDYVNRYIENCVDVVRERSGAGSINLLGYCMGGTMAAMYAAIRPEKVRNLAMMAASLCFSGDGGVLELWGDDEYYSPADVAETFGVVPAEFFDLGFQLMDPVENTVTKYVRLYENLDDEEFVENFARMEKWLSDGIDMAGETYRQYLEEIYQENRFYRNDLYLGEEHADVEAIDMPVLQIVATYDHLVPPGASKPFNDVIASDDTAIIEGKTGHIGLSVSSRSHAEIWPAVVDWFAERSGDGDDLESIDGIGPAYAERLAEAGVQSTAELADADAAELAGATGIGEGRIAAWIDAAAGR